MVVGDVPILRRRRRALPGLTGLFVVIPLSSGRRTILFHQQTRAHAHTTIVGLHQPSLGILLEMRGHPATAIEEVLGADACRDQPATRREDAEVLVEPPFVGLLVFEARGLGRLEDQLQVLREALPVILVAQPEVSDLMPLLGQEIRHATHSREDCDDLLGVVNHIVRLRTDLHKHIGHRRVLLAEPGMLRVQLVAEDETDGRSHVRKGGRKLPDANRSRPYLARRRISIRRNQTG